MAINIVSLGRVIVDVVLCVVSGHDLIDLATACGGSMTADAVATFGRDNVAHECRSHGVHASLWRYG